MHKAKSQFYLSEINSATIHMQQTARAEKFAPFQNIYLIEQLPAIFGDFFLNKVKQIRTSIDQHKL